MEQKHPTPWRLAGGMVDGYAIIDANNNVVLPTTALANDVLRHIVECVNACALESAKTN